MISKLFIAVCAQVVLIQCAFGKPASTISGNSVVENNVILSNGLQAASALPALGLGIGSVDLIGNGGYSSGASALSLANAGSYGAVNAGLSLANSGIDLVQGSGLGLGSGVGLVNAGNIGVVGSGYNLADLNVVSSGPLVVTSISPIGPTGLAVASELGIEGAVLVSGSLPFLSAVAFEGALPTSGSGLATCGCGTGSVGITSEGFPIV